jgi:hypothetical protein
MPSVSPSPPFVPRRRSIRPNGKASASRPSTSPTVPSSAKMVNGNACADERSGGSPRSGPRFPTPTPVSGCASPIPVADTLVSICCSVDPVGSPRPSTSSGLEARMKNSAAASNPTPVATLSQRGTGQCGSRTATTYATTMAAPVRDSVMRMTSRLSVHIIRRAARNTAPLET